MWVRFPSPAPIPAKASQRQRRRFAPARAPRCSPMMARAGAVSHAGTSREQRPESDPYATVGLLQRSHSERRERTFPGASLRIARESGSRVSRRDRSPPPDPGELSGSPTVRSYGARVSAAPSGRAPPRPTPRIGRTPHIKRSALPRRMSNEDCAETPRRGIRARDCR